MWCNGDQRVKCSDCGKMMIKGICIDWTSHTAWCEDCFKKLLADRRAAAEVE